MYLLIFSSATKVHQPLLLQKLSQQMETDNFGRRSLITLNYDVFCFLSAQPSPISIICLCFPPTEATLFIVSGDNNSDNLHHQVNSIGSTSVSVSATSKLPPNHFTILEQLSLCLICSQSHSQHIRPLGTHFSVFSVR